MPLRDHFRPPLDNQTQWEGFHGGWPMMIVAQLARTLPRRYVAAPRVHSGASIGTQKRGSSIRAESPFQACAFRTSMNAPNGTDITSAGKLRTNCLCQSCGFGNTALPRSVCQLRPQGPRGSGCLPHPCQSAPSWQGWNFGTQRQ